MLLAHTVLFICVVLLSSRVTEIVSIDTVSSLCTRCSDNASEILVGLKCNQNNNTFVIHRCCVQNHTASSTVIGLDWSNCNIAKLQPYQFSSVGDSLRWLDLSHNKILFNASTRDRWLGALIKLELLLLPEGVDCSKEAWGSHKTFGQNNTLQLCSSPLYCNESHDKNTNNSITVCPPDSHCIPDGPGLHQCVCNGNRHGYKCIQHTGSFPYDIFFPASIAATLIVIILDRVIRRLIRRRQDSGVQ